MKTTINIEIECTPAEARSFLGLPDVEPIQAAVMERLQERMLSEIDRFSPESLLNQWVSAFPQNAERMQEMFAKTVHGGIGTGQALTPDPVRAAPARLTRRTVRLCPLCLNRTIRLATPSRTKPRQLKAPGFGPRLHTSHAGAEPFRASFIVRCSINCAVQHRALRIGVAAHLGRFLPNLGRSPERPLLAVKR